MNNLRIQFLVYLCLSSWDLPIAKFYGKGHSKSPQWAICIKVKLLWLFILSILCINLSTSETYWSWKHFIRKMVNKWALCTELWAPICIKLKRKYKVLWISSYAYGHKICDTSTQINRHFFINSEIVFMIIHNAQLL